MRLKVYTAGKLKDAPLWRRLRDEWPEVTFTARWPVCHAGITPDTPAFATHFWDQDIEDVGIADVVLIYCESTIDKFRGALVEVGVGLALGKEIITVGEHPDYGTWQYHRNVHRVRDLKEARLLLATMCLSL